MKQNISQVSSDDISLQPDRAGKHGYRHFGGFIAHLNDYGTNRALTIRRFIKIERYSYHDVYRLSHQAAHYLTSLGIKPGDRVMVVAANSPAWVVLFLGCQLIGAALVPVDARNNYQTVSTFIDQTKPKIVFHNDHFLTELDGLANSYHLEDFLTQVAMQQTAPYSAKLSGDETSVIVFTSGTTAAPKGVVLTQKNILANVRGACQALSVGQDWRFLSVLPLSHMYELTGGCTVPLASGASIYYIPRVTPGAIVKALNEYHITILLAVPQLLALFLAKIKKSAEAEGQLKKFEGAVKVAPWLPVGLRRHLFAKVHAGLGGQLRIMVTGGAPIPLELDKAWEAMGVTTIQGYGLTETAPVLTMNTLHRRYYESQGHVLKNVKVRIAKDSHEIQAKGPSIFSGYFENPAATREAFTADGWFKTGDVGRLDYGWLRIQGRAKFAIVRSSGLKVFPEDVEVVADRQSIFKEVCVVGVKVADGETVHAVVISSAKDSQIEAAVAQINQKLESFQHIDGWSRWADDDFPRTRLLKIDRKTVQAWANDESANRAATAAGPNSAGSADKLLGVVRQALDKPRQVIHDSDVLSELGLDSLRRLAVVSMIEDEMGVAVAEAKITQRTTVHQLRQLVARGSAAPALAPRPSWPYNRLVRAGGNLIRNTLITGLTGHYVNSTISGSEHLARLNTPAIFIFNHVDGLDGPVVYQSLPKTIRNKLAVAIADDIMRSPDWKTIGFSARLLFGGFNFARVEPFTPSLEYVGSLVDKGYNIALAPEGHISNSGKLEDFKAGIGLLAVELGIPVVPIKTRGLHGVAPLSKRWPQKHANISVTIGEPLIFSAGDNYAQVTAKLHAAVQKL